MKKYLLLLALLSSCASIRDPYLYEATKGDTRISLLGTVHLMVNRRELPDVVYRRLDESKVAFFELPLSNELLDKIIAEEEALSKEERTKRQVKLYGVGEGDPLLDQRLSAADWKRFVARVPSLPEKNLRYLNPRGGVAILLEQDASQVHLTQQEARSLNPYNGMDVSLARLAAEKGIPVEGLDKDNQPCLYERGSGNVSDLIAVLNGKNLQQFIDEKFELADAYREGNDARVLSYIDYSHQDDRCLIDDRNKAWAEKLRARVKPGQKVFVAVGLAHLLSVETRSLLDLLRLDGYKITRVKAD